MSVDRCGCMSECFRHLPWSAAVCNRLISQEWLKSAGDLRPVWVRSRAAVVLSCGASELIWGCGPLTGDCLLVFGFVCYFHCFFFFLLPGILVIFCLLLPSCWESVVLLSPRVVATLVVDWFSSFLFSFGPCTFLCPCGCFLLAKTHILFTPFFCSPCPRSLSVTVLL